jgi:hypothetical protein
MVPPVLLFRLKMKGIAWVIALLILRVLVALN